MASRGRLTVAKSRSGRRPLRVSTLLKKEKEGTLYKHSSKLKEDLPWYTAAGGGATGALLGNKIMPKKLKAVGNVGGAIAGTGAGLELANLVKKKLAGKYGKNSVGFDLQGKTEVQGIPVAIENRKGSVREGKNEDGTKWKAKFKIPYGYIEGTKGADGEEVDAYVGPDKEAPKAFVVRQKKDNGGYDEDTVMLGFKSKAEAKKGILAHYDDPKHVGQIHTVTMDRLRRLVEEKRKLVKIAASVAGTPVFSYKDSPEPYDTGKAATSPKKIGDVPDRDVGTAPVGTEERQMLQAARPVVKQAFIGRLLPKSTAPFRGSQDAIGTAASSAAKRVARRLGWSG